MSNSLIPAPLVSKRRQPIRRVVLTVDYAYTADNVWVNLVQQPENALQHVIGALGSSRLVVLGGLTIASFPKFDVYKDLRSIQPENNWLCPSAYSDPFEV